MQTWTASAPAAALSNRGPPRWLPLPVPVYSVKKPAVLLAVVLMLFVTTTCIAAMLYYSFDPRLTLFCVYLWLFYGTLYSWRRLRSRYHYHRQQHAVLRRGLGYMAVGLGVFLSAILLYSFARVIPLPQTVGVWLFALLVAYCLYRVIVLHIEEEEEESVQVHRSVRPPV